MEKELSNLVLDRFKRGDPYSFEKIFDFYYKSIFVFAFKMVRNKEDAEDISMQIFDKLFRRFDQFQTLPNIKAFLYISVRNKSLDYIRATQYRDERHKQFVELMSADDEVKFEYDIYQDLLEAVNRAVNKLPNACQRIFRMMFYEHLESGEIAAQLGISLDNVRNQKKRALQLLRLELKEQNILIWLAYLIFTFFSRIFL